eukprot:TRINITY_DN3540_c0_g2_i1.p1 TRINITY_DN3540_c0_g2~~TRINITY_DN3540_c0_g2_i1.p1  ORF type:complete len:570 (+),score=208.90 TRINITY_DN3540_c0_g2_i1:54-1763(+)
MLPRSVLQRIVAATRTLASYPTTTVFGRCATPEIYNEPMFSYAPGTPERAKLQEACAKIRAQDPIDIPCVVGSQEFRDTGVIDKQVMPSLHSKVLANVHLANKEIIDLAIKNALEAKPLWEALPFEDKAAIFLKAADLISTKYRAEINAATMLGQAKTVRQAEIDSAAELADFLRFNVKYAQEIYSEQPISSTGCWNRMEYRPLEGYVVAISPFNFTAIGGNLACAPALMGNVVLWKPSQTAALSNYTIFKILKEAGLPDGVIQFIPADGPLVGDNAITAPNCAGVHFTGSTATFNKIWSQCARYLEAGNYKSYPRLVGETGGKDFHFVHESADLTNVVLNTLRGAFEYQGQKCSACSRAYVPDTIWPEFKKMLVQEVKKIAIGQPDNFKTFFSAVIDHKSFNNVKKYIQHAKDHPEEAEIIIGGNCDDSEGYFVEPTIILTTNPNFKTMKEEIFGPVLTIYVYEASKYEETLRICDQTSPYALTGAIFANDRYATDLATRVLRNSSGNFYINDKCTGAVVGQQPFGGSRASGTNDKAGSKLNLLRWVSNRTVKENFVPLTDWTYPHMH